MCPQEAVRVLLMHQIPFDLVLPRYLVAMDSVTLAAGQQILCQLIHLEVLC